LIFEYGAFLGKTNSASPVSWSSSNLPRNTTPSGQVRSASPFFRPASFQKVSHLLPSVSVKVPLPQNLPFLKVPSKDLPSGR